MNLRLRSLFDKFSRRSNLKSDTPETAHSLRLSGRQFLDDLRHDLHVAGLGSLRKPLFSIIAILSLAIGVGLNTAIFSYFNGLVFIPRPVQDPGSLYEVEGVTQSGRKLEPYSSQEYITLRDQNQVFQQLIADYSISLNTPDGPLRSYLVSGNYFESLGIRPFLGRSIRPEDDQLSSAPVVVLSQSAWRGRFRSDPQIIGKQIELAARNFTVVGVTSNDVEGLDSAPTDLWAPLSARGLFTDPSYLTSPAELWLRLVGRLKAGITSEQASASLDSLLPEVTKSRPQHLILTHVELESFATYSSWDDFPWQNFGPFIIVFSLVLLMACNSISMVQLARALSLRREIAELLAQGVSRSRIIRQLLTESLLLILVGGAIGLFFSHGFIVLLRKVILDPESAASPFFAVTLDLRIFCFALFLSLIASVIVGLFPALRATRLSQLTTLGVGGGVPGRKIRKGRLHYGLVVSQCALILGILSLAGSLIRHQVKFSSAPLGFDTSQELFVRLKLGADRSQFWNKLSEIPGVVSVANQRIEPLYNRGASVPISLGAEGSNRLRAGFNVVSPEYFKTLGIPLLRGRVFTSEEANSKSNVTVVSQATALRFWPGQDPIGKQMTINYETPRTVQVVGVVGGVINKIPVDGVDANFIYLPLNPAEPTPRFLMRVEGDLGSMQRTIRTIMSTAYPIADFDMYPLADWINERSYKYTVYSWVGAALGIFLLLLAFMEIYGILAQFLSLKASPIGVHPTLGDERRQLSRAVFFQGCRLILISIGCGLLITLGSWYLLPDPVMKSHLADPLVLLVTIGSFIVTAFLAVSLAVRKTWPVDPTVSRRSKPVPLVFSKMALKLETGEKVK
jgi:putative ABC transport system permease protein